MDFKGLKEHIYDLNEDELFYKKYYYARQQKYSLEEFLAKLDKEEVIKRKLIIPEVKETIPPKFLDSFVFDLNDINSITVLRHNRYSPDIIHSHTFFELAYVYEGKCIEKINGKTFELHNGDICIIPPDVEHSIGVFDDNTIVINVMLRKDTLQNVFNSFLLTSNKLSTFFLNNIYGSKASDYIIFHTGADLALPDGFLWALWEYNNNQEYSFQCISSTMTLIFYLIVRNNKDSIETPHYSKRNDELRNNLITFIRNNYQDISLDSIAEEFDYTPEYISKLIKETTGLTYSEILLRIRMEKAAELLVNTNMSVYSIAYQTGYEATEHFIRQFKKYSGYTPTQYRKKNLL